MRRVCFYVAVGISKGKCNNTVMTLYNYNAHKQTELYTIVPIINIFNVHACGIMYVSS